jgi:hypothetical protein
VGNERADQLTACTLDSIAIEKTDGQVIAVRSAPGPPFQSRKNTPWDLLRRAYFNGYALWTADHALPVQLPAIVREELSASAQPDTKALLVAIDLSDIRYS